MKKRKKNTSRSTQTSNVESPVLKAATAPGETELEVISGRAVVHASGARSGHRAPRFDLVPPEASVRIAHRFAEGAAIYGAENWKKGIKDYTFIINRFNHAQEHLTALRERFLANPEAPLLLGDDDLAAVGWFVHFMAHRDA